MKATLYKTLSNEQTPIELLAGQTIQEAMPDLNLENAIIIVNGKIEKPTYTLKEKDIITIRLTPGAISASTVAVIAIISAVVAVGAGIAGGVALYKAKEAAEEAEAELDKAKKLSNNPDIDNRPFLRGASNTVATGNSQPYIIGRHFFTPYLLCNPFYKLSGEDGKDEYTYTALECGFNKQILQTIGIDDVTIKTFSDTTPQEGAYDIDTSIFAEDGRLEIAQDGALLSELTELNYKVVSEACNDEIPHDSDVKEGTESYLTYTLNQYAKDVDIAITFPYGLYAFNDDGDVTETKTTVVPEYSLDGGNTWTSFTFDNNGTPTNTFKRAVSTKELRYVAHKDFTLSDYDTVEANGASAIWIRVRNEGSTGDSMIHNDCYVLYYQSVCYDPDKSTSELVPCKVVEDRERAFCTILGIKLKATANNEDKLKKINIITQGVARTWNGTEWSATKTATRNPAAWLLEIETSDSHPLSKYDDSELDLDSIGDFYEFCETCGYKFDYTITQNTKKDDVLNHILEATGACIYYDIYGRRAIAIDRAQENALAVYNPQNIISIQNKKTFGRRTDGLRLKYTTSKDDLYQEETYLLMRDGCTLSQDSTIKDVTVTGITTYEHIVKYARRLMAIEVLRPKTTTIETGPEGVFYTPYSKILIQDDSLKVGIGKGFTINECEWRSGLLKKIYTNEPLTFDASKSYGIIVNCYTADGVQTVPLKVEGTGTTTELTVTTTLRASADAIPETNNIFSFGELDSDGEFTKVTTEYLISQVKRSDNGFNLELVNYDESIYDSGEIPEYKSNITRTKTATKNTIPVDAVTQADLTQAISGLDVDGGAAANEAAAVVTHGVHFTNTHKINYVDGSDTIDSLRQALDEVMSTANDGISVTEERITLQITDTEKELRALIDVQASAVTALVEGGGASGQMSLSLELPVVIDAATRAKFVTASSEGEVAAVYAQLDGTSGDTIKYAIQGNASDTAVKALWDKAVAANLIASQIDLSATQINVAAENVVITGATNKGQTIIEGGYLKTALIDVENILTKNITVKDKGVLTSSNYNGTIDENGNITAYGSAGWAIDHAGKADFTNGNFSGTLNSANGRFTGDLIGGKVYFSALGLYGLSAGDVDNDINFKPSMSGDDITRKGRFTFDVANSSLRLHIHIFGSAGGDSGAKVKINLGIYYKKNGSVSTSNYDQKDTYSETITVGNTRNLTDDWDFTITEPGEYIEVLFTYSTNSIPISSGDASIKISNENKYLKSCVDITEL